MKSRSHDDATVESLRQDLELAAAYLNDVVVDGSQEELMIALRRVSSAYDGVGEIAPGLSPDSTRINSPN
jgi:DNA-binding phage protein